MGLTFLSCSNSKKMMDGKKMLDLLNEKDISLIVWNNDSLSEYNQIGVKDLLYLVQNEPERLKDAIVADKVIGKGSASLMILGGVKEVYTNAVSIPARKFLEQAGIKLFAKEDIPMIINRDRTGQCPLETRLNEVTNPQDCLPIIIDFYSSMQQKIK